MAAATSIPTTNHLAMQNVTVLLATAWTMCSRMPSLSRLSQAILEHTVAAKGLLMPAALAARGIMLTGAVGGIHKMGWLMCTSAQPNPPTLPYPDIKCDAVLTGPLGPCCCRNKDTATGVTRTYLIDVVAPTVKEVYGEPMVLLLAPALIWAAFDESVAAQIVVPPPPKKLIVVGFPGPTPANNPAEKVTLLVSGDVDPLRILDLMTQDGTPSEGAAHTAGGNMMMASGGGGNNEEMAGIFSLLYQQQIEETKRENKKRTDSILNAIKGLGVGVPRIARQPVIYRVGVMGILDPVAQLAESPRASLSPRPANLYVLWKEYEFGICSRKPAKAFNEREGGGNKADFCHRKVFWDVMPSLLRLGYTNETAIVRIYA
jgi:hypothetical protein